MSFDKEHVIKSVRAKLLSALDALDCPATELSFTTVHNAGNQAIEAAKDLYRLSGRIDVEQERN